ncbi:MAG: hypothetical protein AB7U20_16390 [Planctomycetaceae bacterium]
MTPIDPSPDELAAACREIQAGWSEGDELARRTGPHAEPWTVPAVGADSAAREPDSGGAH